MGNGTMEKTLSIVFQQTGAQTDAASGGGGGTGGSSKPGDSKKHDKKKDEKQKDLYSGPNWFTDKMKNVY